jgi:ParB family chromosome partitioning protein
MEDYPYLCSDQIHLVPIDDITISDTRRAVGDVSDLADSIQESGLLNPITVTPGRKLVAGGRRLAAFKLLGKAEIPAFIRLYGDLHAELAEIDENLVRAELTVLERGEQLARRKTIYDALHPEAPRGPGRPKKAETISAFTTDAASKTGVTSRSVRQEVQIATSLSPEVRDAIRTTDLANSKVELLALCRCAPEEQMPLAAQIVTGKARTIKEAERVVRREQRAAQAEAANGLLGLPVEPTTSVSPGEWWRLGRHLLYCGDTSDEAFISRVPRAAFAFADPPYNVGAAEWDHDFAWRHDWLIDHAEIVAVTPGNFPLFDFARLTTMPYRWQIACWIDNGMTRGDLGFANWIGVCLFTRDSLHRDSQDVIRVSIQPSESGETTHKGRKPSELLVWLLDTFTEPGDVVIDPFLGSGSTLFAAEASGRTCHGGELRPEFCMEIIGRWEAKTGLRAEVER